MGTKVAKADVRIAKIAARQHGVVSSAQLREIGVSSNEVRRRAESGRLHRLHQGVYAVGHTAPSMRREWMAAVIALRRGSSVGSGARRRARVPGEGADDPIAALAAGDALTILDCWGAALSHRSAAELWGLLLPRDGLIEVSVSGSGGKKGRREIRVHRSLSLLPAHVTLRSGIPVTTPARTIADLCRVVVKPGRSGLISPWELRRAIRQAEVFGLPLGDDVESDGTRSDLEGDFLHLCRRYRLPAPKVNIRVGPHLVDFLWRDRRLIVETDSFAYHGGRTAFQDDRGRDLDLRARGFQVIRLAEKQVNEEPQRVAAVVGAALRVGADVAQTA